MSSSAALPSRSSSCACSLTTFSPASSRCALASASAASAAAALAALAAASASTPCARASAPATLECIASCVAFSLARASSLLRLISASCSRNSSDAIAC